MVTYAFYQEEVIGLLETVCFKDREGQGAGITLENFDSIFVLWQHVDCKLNVINPKKLFADYLN